jgi:CO/xanthine dehydrogenase FAD-binding subunit
MILEYHRPKQMEEAIRLLEREAPVTFPLGGGTALSQAPSGEIAVVDLQALGLNQIEQQGSWFAVGATATLEALVQHPDISESFKTALKLETTLNTRHAATAAGRLVVGDGASPYLCMLLASDARLIWQPGNIAEAIGDYLSLRQNARPRGRLITQIELPVQPEVRFASVGRTPMDRMILGAAVARWPSGRTRIVLGGEAPAPILVMDGTELNGIEIALLNACSQLGNTWASETYIKTTSLHLIKRLANA